MIIIYDNIGIKTINSFQMGLHTIPSFLFNSLPQNFKSVIISLSIFSNFATIFASLLQYSILSLNIDHKLIPIQLFQIFSLLVISQQNIQFIFNPLQILLNFLLLFLPHFFLTPNKLFLQYLLVMSNLHISNIPYNLLFLQNVPFRQLFELTLIRKLNIALKSPYEKRTVMPS